MLHIVSTPIGNLKDITLRALETLKSADILIGEERKELFKLMKQLGVEIKDWRELNEHSKPEEVEELLQLCKEKNMALVSDCGTPVFCDPGAKLIFLCRKHHVVVDTNPGASSLMALLSLSSINLRDFLFQGFLPANNEERAQALKKLEKENRPIVIMDTPYRLSKTLSELAKHFPKRRALLGKNLTYENQEVQENWLTELAKKNEGQKAEFILLIY